METIPDCAEIQKVMFRLNPNKAPGPDRLTSGFYKAAWGTVGSEVSTSIQQFFTSTFLPSTANATILTLVPKFPGASLITEFRSITCLNTVYKVISTILVSRLKPLLPTLILPMQTAFVTDRLLVENTILAGKLINGYHRSRGPKRVAIKVDIAKTFDTISWDFLFNCLASLSLPPLYLDWLRACISTPHYTIGYNGKIRDEVGASSEQTKVEFSSGLTQSEKDTIMVSTGMPCGNLHVRYLGVPLNYSKLSMANCAPLLDKVKSRISSWSVKSLSFAGRLQLLNTVIARITNFWCSSFILPKECIKRINSMCFVFLWTGSAEGHNSARVKLRSEGGLGIRNLLLWNKACILKLVWMLFFRAGSIWVAWFKEGVLKGDISNYWSRKTSHKLSWLANKLIKLRDLVFPWIKISMGNGQTCRFWYDNWTPFGSLLTYLGSSSISRLGIPLHATVSSLYTDGNWNIPPARTEAQSQSYSTKQVYNAICDQGVKVPWEQMVWCKGGVLQRTGFLVGVSLLTQLASSVKWLLSQETTCFSNALLHGDCGVKQLDVRTYPHLNLGMLLCFNYKLFQGTSSESA
ncbi:PREDICTED: uncharacterized protein LOC106298041 [Brassica oleracea var. oleracea]|uniref:uncharacterized protein LOC106298041 n=1 Tax=Brassica oleracea var. oleracea TaxID=109376 RepID=UPI0006A6EFF1|nr:PREDICTED: uncharacterized protein LOC106298041 [Brassica oleracea var. oleracea]